MLLERMLLLLKQLRMMGNWVGPWTPMLAEKSLGANVEGCTGRRRELEFVKMLH